MGECQPEMTRHEPLHRRIGDGQRSNFLQARESERPAGEGNNMRYGLYFDSMCRFWVVHPVRSLKRLAVKYETGKRLDLQKKSDIRNGKEVRT